MDERMVLLYGKSLLLSGVAVGLAGVPGLHVARAGTWADASRMMAEQMPDVLIFDLNGTCESHVLALLLENPHPTMVGLDTERNQAVLLSGQATRSLTLDQMRQIASGERQRRVKAKIRRRRRGLSRAREAAHPAGAEEERIKKNGEDGKIHALSG